RSIADNQTELDRAIASGDVDVPDGATPEEEQRILRQAAARPREGATTFVTGGDVSRFQPRTLQTVRPVTAEAQPNVTVQVAAGSGGGTPVYSGPSVRVSRGKTTVVEPVGRGAGALLDRQ